MGCSLYITLLGLACIFVVCSSTATALGGTEQLSSATESFEKLSGAWRSYWGRTYSFIDIADGTNSLEGVLSSCEFTSAVVAVLGDTKPQRRNANVGVPFIQIANLPSANLQNHHSIPVADQNSSLMTGGPSSLDEILGLPVLNKGVEKVEAILGRRLHAFRYEFMPFPAGNSGCRKPYVVWNVSSGTISVDEQLVSRFLPYTDQIKRGTHALAEALSTQLSIFISSDAASSQGSLWSKLVTSVLPGALLLALGAQIPLWFCIACPVVLGLLAPFVFNAGLGAAADAICSHYSLPIDECNDLWYGAFAAAMILSFASAIPIVFICQIPKCSQAKA